MSLKQLRSLLKDKGVDATGCLEKGEFIEALLAAGAISAPAAASAGASAAPAATAAAAATIAPLAPIESVQVAELDAQHDACASALAKLAAVPTRGALERVLRVYKRHFEHEEMLLDRHLYSAAAKASAAGVGFSAEASARRSHYADHERMLSELRAQVAALPSAEHTAPPAFVDKVLRDFEYHANVYDANYAEPLAARLREGED